MISLKDIDWHHLLRGPFHPSPQSWEDQTFYFLLVDRFSDGNEAHYRDITGEIVEAGETPPFQRERDAEQAVQTVEGARAWNQAGGTWCGGNLRGLATKLGYLKRLGITALWISPLLKQAIYAPDSFHGYGTQNFLAVDPHFGTASDLRALVATAHQQGMYVVLDIILNHTADVFAYSGEEKPLWREEPHPVAGFRDAEGKPVLPFEQLDGERYPQAYPEGAVWPHELQRPESFTRKGRILNWDDYPEYEEGDFFDYKDIFLGTGTDEDFTPSTALQTLVEVYKYWIAYADLDGFRIDTVKHMPNEAVAYFAREIHSFARSLGKRNFYLIGEIVGNRATACTTLECSGLNAALGIAEVPKKIRSIIVGTRSPAEYFDIFANSRLAGQNNPDPVWWKDRVVTFFDDHDQVGKKVKGRLAAQRDDIAKRERLLLRAFAFQLFTLGVPCLYYGTEQGFDGHALAPDQPQPEDSPAIEDRYIRECMFGGEFGAFRSRGKHFFDEEGRLYQELAKMLRLRQQFVTLRRGRQYLREISSDGDKFWIPTPLEEPYLGLIAWSRLLDVEEFVCVLNTDCDNIREAWVTVDADRHPVGSGGLRCLYSTHESQIGSQTDPPESRNGSAIPITLPPGGFALFR